MKNFDFDLFVIGGGSGGVRAARMAAQRGARVALAEVAAMGGTCVNVGCIPKKLYSYAAHYAEAFEESRGFGWTGEAPVFNWEQLKTNRALEISRLNGVYIQLLQGSGVQIIEGWATLADAHTVEVEGSRYTAKHILIATGGRPSLPEVKGRELVITSDQIFDIAPFPARLLVVGGGYIACEFASIFNGLGSKVTQLYRGAQVLRGFDAEVRAFVAAEMIKTGVDLRLHADVAAISQAVDGLHVQLQDGSSTTVDAVLYATGRLPNVAGLGLENAGVPLNHQGAIEVNAHYQTSVPSIYALGDVTARIQLTPVALGEAMVVVDHLFGAAAGKKPRHMSYDFIPTAVFTHPNIGTVGYSEADARKEFGKVSIYRSEFKALKHTLSGSTERTLMKLVVDDASDRVVGLHMVGADAGEVVQGFAVAMKAGATKAIFDSTIGIHPTAAEEFVTMREPVKEPSRAP
ncbi:MULTISPECIES: glutathione-disulfide reductase [unclassified Polaromonas]|jgi:glutathione reductase (NADPH)|uniref:glutathione-disulfide reductase n=1 Tax=unclassified Polaromonas TaxID=2638319 RepID=UPI000BC87077|nr:MULTISPECIES: glutathione-disulfide reductase [unclassified Polaromonas]OYY39682.1 MAG: glutathione-disulfide reductase [Polaromonas sp. 35-63-35]OYZ22427.1 MAG: glutathione-disulfide reductase [Polaromonas sp. 16-63-31]OYZ81353.1 MAG: glutathione-disulfide reductase [Polaromonas sp. 24-63-21]OZA52422.1 MAG: glutathione-disulfide reductase [Polaromonas sp. 17-63-33]OZA88714.1 MAG: glutathione-disulfide reductase [Polaromonas sp. 39-63-25]